MKLCPSAYRRSPLAVKAVGSGACTTTGPTLSESAAGSPGAIVPPVDLISSQRNSHPTLAPIRAGTAPGSARVRLRLEEPVYRCRTRSAATGSRRAALLRLHLPVSLSWRRCCASRPMGRLVTGHWHGAHCRHGRADRAHSEGRLPRPTREKVYYRV